MAILSELWGEEYPRNQYIGVAKNGLRLEIVYHIHLTENTGFLEDLFRQTKADKGIDSSYDLLLARIH